MEEDYWFDWQFFINNGIIIVLATMLIAIVFRDIIPALIFCTGMLIMLLTLNLCDMIMEGIDEVLYAVDDLSEDLDKLNKKIDKWKKK